MNILEYENYHETITHGDIIFPYNTYLCSIPLDFPRVPLHWHDELELIYIKKGMGRITVDFREYKVKGPTLVLILPGQLHSIDQLEDAFMEYENIIFNPSMLIPRQNDVTATDFLLPLMSGKVTVPTIFTPVYPYYTDVIMPIDACDEISKTKPQGYELYIKSQLYQFFFILDNRCRNLTTGDCQAVVPQIVHERRSHSFFEIPHKMRFGKINGCRDVGNRYFLHVIIFNVF